MTARRRDPLARVGRDAFLISRGAGDVRAFRRGRLPARLGRRAVTRTILRALWGR